MDHFISISEGASEYENLYETSEYTWPEFSSLLTTCKLGEKSGASFTPATFKGDKRGKENAKQIGVLVLDIDAGYSWETVSEAVKSTGWKAAIATSFSHMSSLTKAKKKAYDDWKGKLNGGDNASYGAFLVDVKKRLPEIVQNAEVKEIDGDEYIFRHNPCPKFRIAFPMAEPWRREDYLNLNDAETAFKNACRVVSERLGLEPDESCIDIARLFFLPRAPTQERMDMASGAVFEGELCPALLLGDEYKHSIPTTRSKDRLALDTCTAVEVCDPETGEVTNLTDWAVQYSNRFELAKAARAGAWPVRNLHGVKLAVDCPFEEGHSSDTSNGTIVANASDFAKTGMTAQRKKSFTVHCSHDSCGGRDRLDFLGRAIELGWLKTGSLKDSALLTEAAPATLSALVSPENWPEPLDIFGDATLSGSPSLPCSVLPPVLEAFAIDKAERLGVDPSMIALPALAVCASALDDNYQLQSRVHDTEWKESARLWVAVVEEAGGKKTPAISAATAPLNKIESRWAEQDELTRDERDREQKIYDVKLKQYVLAASKGSFDKPPVAPPEYVAKRLVVSDATIEALSTILHGNPSGILAHHDELSGWIGSFDAYKGKSAGRDRALWLELYNGKEKPIDRVSRGRVLVPNWSASIIGGIQPGPIKRIVGNLSDDGLLQRFIVVHGKQAGSGIDRLPDEKAMCGYTSVIERLVAARTDSPVVVKFADDAQYERAQVVRAVEALKSLPDTSPAFRAHLNKWEALFARIALTFHAVETIGTTGGAILNEVSGDTAARVAQFMLDFLLPNAARFYSETFKAEGQIENARWVAGYILSRKLEKISFRDVGRAYRTLRDDADSIQAAMDALTMAGWVEPIDPDRFGRAKKWAVNPAVHGQFVKEAKAEKLRREEELARIQESIQTLGLTNKEEAA